MSEAMDLVGKQHQPLPQIQEYIPAWAPEVPLELEVREDGKPAGFRVQDILPSRRWAIDPQSGEVISQDRFDRLYKEWISRRCLPDGQIVHIARVNQYFNPELESVPNVRHWIRQIPDGAGRLKAVDYDPNAKSDEGTRYFYDHTGEHRVSEKQADVLQKLERLEKMRGLLSDEEFGEKRDALLAGSGMALDEVLGIKKPGSEKPEGFAPVEADPVSETPAAEPPTTVAARCGKPCKNEFGRQAHERRCKKCAEVPA